MADSPFLAALQKITAGGLGLVELVNIAGNLSAAGQPALARQLYKIWINFNPDHPQLFVALFNGSAFDTQVGDNAAAADALSRAIALNPDFLPAYINLGGVLERNGEVDRALEMWRSVADRPAVLDGNSVSYAVTALKQMTRVLSERQSSAEAEAAVRRCLSLNPQQKDVIEQFMALRLSQCKWPVATPWEGVERAVLLRGTHPLSMGVYTDDPMLQLASACHYVRESDDYAPTSLTGDRRHAPVDLEARRLRVGYVSSDLRDHAIGYLMAELFELHDKSNVEVFAYYCGRPPSGALYERIKTAVEHWADIREMSDDDAASLIAADGIDILVDVNGHTRDSKTGVFARRPAPIQVNWLGYPGSMGSPYHHYVIADDWIIPAESEIYYSEKVVRLPCYQPNDRKRVIADQRPTRAQAGLPEDATVFCCFNGAHKISRFTFERWMEVLKRVPASVLWLLETTAETNERLAATAQQYGVDRSRIVFAPKLANAHHLARYPLADLFLDTSPYGAHTTCSDALWMGVPVVTLSGRGFPSRVCGSLLRAAGLPELVTHTSQDYVDLAVRIGSDRQALDALKAKLAAGRDSCLLFDTGRLARELEGLYLSMCEDYQSGRLHQPDLTNLDVCLEIGISFDHEGQEMTGVPGYEAGYRSRLALEHLARPMRADGRLWTDQDIAAVDAAGREAAADQTRQPRRKRQAAA
jgi:predicted O-linked N-acetylglucosamine transferase (SPINDLY family)